MTNIDKSKHLTADDRRTIRWNHRKLFKEFHGKNNRFKFSFFRLAIEEWNKLREDAVHASSLSQFMNDIEVLLTR